MGLFVLSIETGNAAFGETREERTEEIAATLQRIADRAGMLALGYRKGPCPVLDVSGNRIGSWEYVHDAEGCDDKEGD